MRMALNVLLVSLAAAALTGQPRAQTVPATDLVLVNGTILTVDTARHHRGGRRDRRAAKSWRLA
jgi:hypothetical protein